ncbi:hypothetical protein EJW09_11085 [Salmonella enterica subsp. enterica serovar Braenderup]|nr:hypothetical protein [Salmonella enterica subsp. enterica serovar Braenderup]
MPYFVFIILYKRKMHKIFGKSGNVRKYLLNSYYYVIFLFPFIPGTLFYSLKNKNIYRETLTGIFSGIKPGNLTPVLRLIV